jgi:hypothetical protein
MGILPDERDRGSLGPYLACAAAIHAGFFALSPVRAAEAPGDIQAAAVVGSGVNVDVEPATSDPDATPPGGGSPIAGTPVVATARPPVPSSAPPKPGAVAAKSPVALVSSRVDRLPSMDQSQADEAPAMAVAQASNDRRERGMAMAAAAASAGVGRGAGGGPAGGGARWGAPPIRGSIAFGNGSRGALTGRVCFVPVGTLRIADVQACDYVATVYTDTLDIPERHFSDGFPGVTNRSEWFLIDYTGTFSATAYGTYVFRLHSDDGSYLYIDDALVIENDGKHAPESRSGSVQLAVGTHRIKVRYAQTDDRMALQLFVRTPGSSIEAIFRTDL